MNKKPVAAAVAPRGNCTRCGDESLLYTEDPLDPDSDLICPTCSRRQAARIKHWQPCDNHEDKPGWRNPYTRRNEYLCGNCHAESGDGVVLNKWGPRLSVPINPVARPKCEAKYAPGSKECRGEVKPRGTLATVLCNAHAGKVSAGDKYAHRQ